MARNSIQLKVELNVDDVDWFRKQYPKSSLAGTLSLLLEKFREVNQFSAADYAKIAADSLTEDLRNRR